MIGAGIFVLTGIAAGMAGPALIVAFALNGIIAILTALAYAELGSAIPEAGGGYLWVKEGLPGSNAFLAGWMSWFAHAVAGSLYALGFGAYFELVLREFGVGIPGLGGEALQKAVAVAVGLLFVGINFKGVSETGKVGNLVTLAKIAVLGIFVFSGVWAIFHRPQALGHFTPFTPEGLGGVFMAMGFTFIAFEGYEIIAQAGEEVKDPRRNVPRAVLFSMVIVVPIYMLVAFASLGAVIPESGEPSWQWLGQHAELGLAEAARQFMPLGTTLLLVGGLLSTMSALNATTFSSTRVSFAMGRDRNLPDIFARVHARTRTPHLALLASGTLIIVMAVAIPIEDVAAAADIMFLLLFLQVNVAVITIRKKYGDKLAYGFLTPFYPVIPALAIAANLFLLVFMFQFSAIAWFFVLAWLGIGFAIYTGYASKRERAKTATPVILEARPPGEAAAFRVLVPVAHPRHLDELVRVGARMARENEGELLVLHVVAVPEQLPISAGRRYVEDARALLDRASSLAEEQDVPAATLVRIAHRPAQAILDTIEDRDVNIVVMGWRGRRRDPQTALGRNLDLVLKQANCHVVILQEGAARQSEAILIPAAYPDQARLSLEVGKALLHRTRGAHLDLLHVLPPGLGETEREARETAFREAVLEAEAEDEADENRRLYQNRVIRIRFEEGDHPDRVIVRTAGEYELLIIGASRERWWRRRVFGERPRIMARASPVPVVLVRRRAGALQFRVQSFFQFFRDLEEEERE